MKYPELLLVPVFMLLDYFLTIVGRIQHEKAYGKHFKLESYELNPSWQTDITESRWINRRHLMLVFTLTLVLVYALEFSDLGSFINEFALGLLLVVYGTLVGRHIANIATYSTFAKNPQLVSGTVTMTQKYVLLTSTWHTLATVMPLAVLLVVVPSAFLAGGVSGALYLMTIHLIWLLRQPMPPATDTPESD